MTPIASQLAPEAHPSATSDERRDGERCECEEIRPVRLLARPSFRALPGFIRDFSPSGIGLIMMRTFDTGTMLALQLRRKQAGVSDILTAHVRHVRPLSSNYWFIGCQLSRSLSDEERRGLLLGDPDQTILWADMES